jgi:hypothetical protein
MHRKVLKAAGLDFRDQPPIVTTTSPAVEMRRLCVWCNGWERDPNLGSCCSPDGDGHLFRLAPYTDHKSGPGHD